MSRPPYYSLSRPSSHICLGHLHCSLIQSIITLVCPGSRPPSYSLFKPSFLTYLSRSSPPWSVHHPSNIFWKWARKSWDRRATGVGRRAGEEIVVWNESPEIPDIGETSWYRWRYWPSTHGRFLRGQSGTDEGFHHSQSQWWERTDQMDADHCSECISGHTEHQKMGIYSWSLWHINNPMKFQINLTRTWNFQLKLFDIPVTWNMVKVY